MYLVQNLHKKTCSFYFCFRWSNWFLFVLYCCYLFFHWWNHLPMKYAILTPSDLKYFRIHLIIFVKIQGLITNQMVKQKAHKILLPNKNQDIFETRNLSKCHGSLAQCQTLKKKVYKNSNITFHLSNLTFYLKIYVDLTWTAFYLFVLIRTDNGMTA